MATGIRAFDKVYRDFLFVYDAFKRNALTYDEDLFYFEKGDGKSILYTMKKTIDNLDSVNRALENEKQKNKSWWHKFVTYLQGKVRSGHYAFWELRATAMKLYNTLKSNVISRDGDVFYFKSRNGRQVLYEFRGLVLELDKALRELEHQAYKDRPWWEKLNDILWARVPY